MGKLYISTLLLMSCLLVLSLLDMVSSEVGEKGFLNEANANKV